MTVVFYWRIWVDPYFGKATTTKIVWGVDLLGGYDHVILPEAESITSTSPCNLNNPLIGAELARKAPDAMLIYGHNFLNPLRELRWCFRNLFYCSSVA